MKNFIKIMTFSVMAILVGAFCLVGCGPNDSGTKETISKSQFVEYIEKEEVTSVFDNFSCSMKMGNVTRMELAQIGLFAENLNRNEVQLKMEFSMSGDATYVKDGFIYRKFSDMNGNVQKIKTEIDDEIWADIQSSITEMEGVEDFSGDIKENLKLMAEQATSIVKITNGDKITFDIAVPAIEDQPASNISLVYVNNKLAECTESEPAAGGYSMSIVFKGIAEIKFPADLDSYVDGVISEM